MLYVFNPFTGNFDATMSAADILPSQTGNAGKFLTTSGTVLSWASATVPLTATQIGFGSGTNILTGSSKLTFDGTNLYLNGNMGIGTATPRGIFDINLSATIGSVASATTTFSYNGDATGNYSANSADVYGVKIIAYKDDVTFGRVYSTDVYKTFGSPNSSGDFVKFTFAWTAVSGATGYFLFLRDTSYMGSDYDIYYDVGNVTSYVFGDPSDNEDHPVGAGTPPDFPTVVGGANAYVSTTNSKLTSYGESIFYGPITVDTRRIANGATDAHFVVKGDIASVFRQESEQFSKFEWVTRDSETDSGRWQIYVNSFGQMNWGMLNDAENAETNFMQFNRSGRTPTNTKMTFKLGLGFNSPPTATASLHLQAGSATASTAPLKFNTGTLLTSPEAGAIEFLTNIPYFTRTTGATRLAMLAAQTGRSTAQNAAVASVVTFTPPADGSFLVSANVLVTTATLHSFTATVTYTDEGNTSRTVTLNFSTIAGAITPTIANAGGTVPYEGVPLHIRAKASTSITIATTGTFTTVVYNVEGMITQIA